MARPASLIDLAASVADGTPIDWEAAQHASADPTGGTLLARLRLVERVAQLHASLPPVESAGLHDSLLHPASRPEAAPDEPCTWGPLTILEKIGRGTFGDIYRARDPRLDRPVALKLLRRREREADAIGSAVIEEGRLMARVRHPNVVTIFGAERIAGRVGLWMELVEGPTLEDELKAKGPFGADEVIGAGRDLCRALGAVHRAGLLHRDLKAQNAMRAPDGTILLTDFGAGRHMDPDGVQPGHELAGTPLYLAPEILDGQPASPASDIYSLGVLLYHLATGTFPVRGRSLHELRDAHRHGDRMPPRAARADLPPRLVGVIERALAVESGARYESAAAMESALEATTNRTYRRRVAVRLGVAAATIASLAIAVWAWRSPFPGGAQQGSAEPAVAEAPVAGLDGRQLILIAAFENRTGDPVLDGTIEVALERELTNSTVLSVVSRARIDDVLHLMQRPTDSMLDASLAREVALRDGGVRAIVLGRIERAGEAYDLRFDTLAVPDGAVLTTFSDSAPSRAELVTAVRRQALRLREALGEMPSSIRESQTALEKVTTPSLPALQFYSQAVSFMHSGGQTPFRNDLAEPLLRTAIAEDQTFASAHVLLAYALVNQGRPPEDYLPHARRAAELADRVSEAERLFIQASYYSLQADASPVDARQNYMRAIDLYDVLLRKYPEYPWARNNVVIILRRLNQEADAIAVVLQGAVVRPRSWVAQTAAAEALLADGDVGRARDFIDRARVLIPFDDAREDPQAFNRVWLFDAYEAWVRGDVMRVREILDDLARRHGQPERLRWEMMDVGLGRFGEARQIPAGAEAPSQQLLALNLGAAWLGDKRARDFLVSDFTQRLRTPGSFQVGASTMAELIRQGRLDAVRTFSTTLSGPTWAVDDIEGQIAAAEGRLDDAAAAFERARNARRPPASDALRLASILAEARETHGDVQGAILDLEGATSGRRPWVESVLDVRGGVTYWIHARDVLARLYRKAGRIEEARAIDAELLGLLAVADADHPVLVALKSRR